MRFSQMLRLAKAIQYLHSMGVVLFHQFRSRNVILDSDLFPKIFCLCSTSRSSLDKDRRGWSSPHDNIFCFGCLFYELYCGVNIWLDYSISSRRLVITKRPSVPEIPEYVWQLIQRCCAEDPKSRPTINEVVKEMEGWHSVGQVEPSRQGKTYPPGVVGGLSRFRRRWVSIITKIRFPKNR
ncbi:Protein kinase-like domain containing protein [Amanita muscaria]